MSNKRTRVKKLKGQKHKTRRVQHQAPVLPPLPAPPRVRTLGHLVTIALLAPVYVPDTNPYSDLPLVRS